MFLSFKRAMIAVVLSATAAQVSSSNLRRSLATHQDEKAPPQSNRDQQHRAASVLDGFKKEPALNYFTQVGYGWCLDDKGAYYSTPDWYPVISPPDFDSLSDREVMYEDCAASCLDLVQDQSQWIIPVARLLSIQ